MENWQYLFHLQCQVTCNFQVQVESVLKSMEPSSTCSKCLITNRRKTLPSILTTSFYPCLLSKLSALSTLIKTLSCTSVTVLEVRSVTEKQEHLFALLLEIFVIDDSIQFITINGHAHVISHNFHKLHIFLTLWFTVAITL